MQMKLIVQQDQVMNSFCWAYSNALLQKIKRLIEEDRLFTDGNKEAEQREEETRYGSEMTEIGYATMSTLAEQINSNSIDGTTVSPSTVNQFIATAEEFLNIFKTNEEKVDTDDLVGDITQLIHEANLADQAAVNILGLLRRKYKFL